MPFLEQSPVGIFISQIIAGTFYARLYLTSSGKELRLNGNGNPQRHPGGERNKAALSATVDDKFDLVQFTSIKWSSFNVKQQSMFL